jgi:hypothetical protein
LDTKNLKGRNHTLEAGEGERNILKWIIDVDLEMDSLEFSVGSVE